MFSVAELRIFLTALIMDPDLKHLYGLEWIITRIDGKIASLSLDWRPFSELASRISAWPASRIDDLYSTKISTQEVFDIAEKAVWDDLLLVGTAFQKKVWRTLFSLTHPSEKEEGTEFPVRNGRIDGLLSYTEFAALCGNASGVRAVAHAVALNPVPVIIPCHLIIPKETADRIEQTEKEADATLFGRDGLCIDPTLHFGQFSLPGGSATKRDLILYHFSRLETD